MAILKNKHSSIFEAYRRELAYWRRVLFNWTITKIVLGLVIFISSVLIMCIVQHFEMQELLLPAFLLSFPLAQRFLDGPRDEEPKQKLK
jgi:hypothetical protein